MVNPFRNPAIFLSGVLLTLSACIHGPERPGDVPDHVTAVAYVRAFCPDDYQLFFDRYGGFADRHVLDCSDYNGELIAFEVRTGMHELVLARVRERQDFRWTRNLFEVREDGGSYYWGDITVKGWGEIQIENNPATIARIGKLRAGRAFDRPVFGVTDE